MTQTIVLASNNAGKLKEFGEMLAPDRFRTHTQGAFNVPEADEPHPTFIENALAKARHAAAVTGLPALADDSGVCVNALGGAPGVLSARYGGEPKSDPPIIASCSPIWRRMRTNPLIIIARWCMCAMPMTRSRLLPKGAGMARLLRARAAPAVSVMIRISGWPTWERPWPNCVPNRKMRFRIAARHCAHWLKNYNDSD